MQSTRFSYQILIKLEFSRQIFGKNIQISNLMEICPVGPVLFHADGQKGKQRDRQTDRHDMTKLIVSYSNFSNTLNKRVLRLNHSRCMI